MAYHTGLYLFIFLPIALIVYQAVPQKHRWKALLFFGYAFFYLISGKLLLYFWGPRFLLIISAFGLRRRRGREGRRCWPLEF